MEWNDYCELCNYVKPEVCISEKYDIWICQPCDKKRVKKKDKIDKFVFITLQDFQRRMPDLDKLLLFMKRIKYIFKECYWCIESGKVPLPDSNLHIHMLCKYNNSKKGKNQICIEWSKIFDTNLRDSDYFDLKQHRDSEKMPPYEQWLQEKLDYFEQEQKGNHENVIDLGARGAWGVSTSFI